MTLRILKTVSDTRNNFSTNTGTNFPSTIILDMTIKKIYEYFLNIHRANFYIVGISN